MLSIKALTVLYYLYFLVNILSDLNLNPDYLHLHSLFIPEYWDRDSVENVLLLI